MYGTPYNFAKTYYMLANETNQIGRVEKIASTDRDVNSGQDQAVKGRGGVPSRKAQCCGCDAGQTTAVIQCLTIVSCQLLRIG